MGTYAAYFSSNPSLRFSSYCLSCRQAIDWMQIFFIGLAAVILLGHVYHIGQSGISTEIAASLRLWYFGEISYALAAFFMKASIALSLLRVAVNGVHRRVLFITLITFTIIAGAMNFVIIFQCWPISFYWLRGHPANTSPGNCMQKDIFMILAYIHASLQWFADLTFGILPIFILKDLRVNARVKIRVYVLLTVGNTYV